MIFEDTKLRIFVTICEKKNFTLAAYELGISQPAVSQNISELERIVGSPLFERGRGEVCLTSEGELFKKYADKILHWYKAANLMFGTSSGGSRQLSVAASADVRDLLLPRAIAVLCTVYKGVVIKISDMTEQANADFSLWTSHRSGPVGVTSDICGTIQAGAFANPSLRRIASLDELAELPSDVRLALWSGYERLISRDLSAHVICQSDSVPSLIALASKSPDIVALAPFSEVPENLLHLPVPLPYLQMDLHFSASAKYEKSDLASAFREAMAI